MDIESYAIGLKKGTSETIAETVTGWLEDNVDPVGSAVVVDSSLTIEGAAADAKKTGDELSELKADFNSLGISVVEGKLCVTYASQEDINE